MELQSNYGKWTVIQNKTKMVEGRRYAYCRCECGKEKYVETGHLKHGKSRSCMSCAQLNKESRNKTHGMTKTKLYQVWQAMKRRCYNKHDKYYTSYGGRGIIVCPEWNNKFESFRDWALANDYNTGMQIDRSDNDGPYSPNNCQFVTPKENARNRRSNRIISIFGEEKVMAAWVEDNRSVVNAQVFCNRLYHGWSPEKALTVVPKGWSKA